MLGAKNIWNFLKNEKVFLMGQKTHQSALSNLNFAPLRVLMQKTLNGAKPKNPKLHSGGFFGPLEFFFRF